MAGSLAARMGFTFARSGAMVWSMAFIESRRTKGGARRYRVWWRLGGSRYGEPQSETFFDKGSALTFKLAVETAGHDWPDNYIKGGGWVREQPQEPAQPVPFGEYALDFVHGLSGVAARTRHDYERDLTRHLLPVFGQLDLRDPVGLTPALVRGWVNA